MQNNEFYISITGLELKSPIYFFSFWWHAVRSMIQARSAPGNISAQAKTINGIHHTLSVWKDEKATRGYIFSGNHLQAIKAFNRIATGKTFGFRAQTIPNWAEVHRIWNEKGVSYGKSR